MRILSLDIETTGLNPNINNVLEIGLVAHDTSNPEVFHSKRILHNFDLKYLNISSGAESVGNNSQLITNIINSRFTDECYVETKLIVPTILGWLYSIGWITESESLFGINKSKLNLLGKNLAKFDLPFLDRWFDFSDKVKYRHRLLDPAVLYLDLSKDSVVPDLQTCLDRSGLSKPEGITHTAVDDAMITLLLLLKGLNK